eukprot:3078495-Prymnesium_polylepis.1
MLTSPEFVTDRKLLTSHEHLLIRSSSPEGVKLPKPIVVVEEVQYEFKVGTITKDRKKKFYEQLAKFR